MADQIDFDSFEYLARTAERAVTLTITEHDAGLPGGGRSRD